ncbi:uncharacterized protein SPPG_08857 [Spizellomyces punctatus DAOM BR117]|uniref:DNA topoisomerase n=2 Tax=Spizellomyces punctatus (strain DAOM BR117) TaxID=645134 RepID=A0A0L0HVJ1_SPIPD|nr:uncharacterized protein SPPG_08857 [Spizellomyces punctatus DAOM BR117]KND04904.1 hypothetical protein SPPG_08857 [Spizellomyces punctatus DAOM BR117]|eukprot:XP_016612943.1 hypothetical protein SPPG_08857 [Spizellomyces punctatus DAOM BR117]
MKVLCVAEKPSIAKSVAQLLSNGGLRTVATRNKYIKNYCFDQLLNGQQCQIVMTALLGHLMESDFPAEYRNWKAVPPMGLFDATVIKSVREDLKTIEDNLKKEARYAQMLIIWTDCDREGENIGAEAAEVCKSANPRIQVKRARFSVIQRRELQQAWNSLGELDMRQAAAVDARAELDLRIGAVFTRFQTLTLRGMFPELGENKILSYGSCQFPTLGFVVDRYMKVQRFVPEDFWKIDVSIEKDGSTAKFDWGRTHLFDQHFTLVLYEKCMDNPTATVASVNTKPKSKWAPLPLTTVEFQKAGSRILRISSDRIMSIAERLYQQGIISYPRTETDVFADSFQLHPLIEAQVNDPRWGQYAQGLLGGRFRRPRKGKNDDQAHPPIHPVKAALDLTGDDQRVYEFITRRFLACCSDAAKGNETVVVVHIAGEQFTAKGLSILERNYLEVYPYDKWAEHSIPNFYQGEQIMPSELTMTSGRTSGPDLLTEADLIGLMEKSGIGTDATIHEHIKKILDREYANKENQFFCPTVLGMALISAYDEMDLELSLSKPYLRSLMEANMKRICEGTRSRYDVVQESLEMYRGAFARASQQSRRLKEVVGRYLRGGDRNHTIPQIPPTRPPSSPSDGAPYTVPRPTAGSRRTAGRQPDSSTTSQGRSRGRGSRGSRGSTRARGATRRQAGTSSSDTRADYTRNRSSDTSDPKPKCDCNLYAARRTSRKNNENQGRDFFTCTKAGAKCRFFAWADEWSANNTNGR